MKRREFLKLSLGTAAVAALSSRARGEAAPKEIRIGTQKGGFFPAVRQRHTVEDIFRPLGIEIKWIDFQFGPPLLEAINVGSVDFGYVGDSPPIFAQAAGARIRYVAAVKSEGNTQAISGESASRLAKVRARTICLSRRLRRPDLPGATSRPRRSRRPMRRRRLLKVRSMPGRFGIRISHWPSSRRTPV